VTQRAPGLTVGGCVRLDADTGTAVDCRDGLASAKIVAITADADACEDPAAHLRLDDGSVACLRPLVPAAR
jgi:hypothetical protein